MSGKKNNIVFLVNLLSYIINLFFSKIKK